MKKTTRQTNGSKEGLCRQLGTVQKKGMPGSLGRGGRWKRRTGGEGLFYRRQAFFTGGKQKAFESSQKARTGAV